MSDVVWHPKHVTHEAHARLNGHRGMCIWLTGLSGAGKSTIANALEQHLFERGIHTYLLDGDNVRHGLNEDLGFDEAAREENVRRVAHVANLFVDAGVVVISALISPFKKDRQLAREIVSNGPFIETFVDCPIDVCMKRDPKGLYERVKNGMIKSFTGIHSPYEAPLSPEIKVNTSEMSIQESVKHILQYVELYLEEAVMCR